MSAAPNSDALYHAAVLDNGHEVIGSVSQVYADDTGTPSYVEVSHGIVGLGNSLVPLHGSTLTGDRLVLPFTHEQVKNAPDHEPGKELTSEREAAILRHFGLEAATETSHGLSRPKHGDGGGRTGRVGDDLADRLRDPHGLDQYDDGGTGSRAASRGD